MRKILFLRILFVFSAFLLLSACEYDTIPGLTPIPPDQTISFSQDILPIFSSNCVDCHNGSRNPDLRANNAYNSLINGEYINTNAPENSKLYEILTGFHIDKASAEERQLILRWIEQGAENN